MMIFEIIWVWNLGCHWELQPTWRFVDGFPQRKWGLNFKTLNDENMNEQPASAKETVNNV
jgi:hypothetical protein